MLIVVALPFFLQACSNEDNFVEGGIDYEDTSVDVMDVFYEDTLHIDVDGSMRSIIESWAIKRDLTLLNAIHRIPSIVITNKGTQLVTCENRILWDDKGDMDILVSRKPKGEKVWHLKRVIPHSAKTYGRSMNPIFLVDRNGKQGHKGRIYLFACHMSCEDYGMEATPDEIDFVYKYSDDDGITWSPEYSLKKYWNTQEYTFVIPSACNGIQLKDGTFLVPTMVCKDQKWRSGIVYKKAGHDWKFSTYSLFEDDNECCVYLDPDDRIVLECRTYAGIRRRYCYNIEDDKLEPLQDAPNSEKIKVEIHESLIDGKRVYLMSKIDKAIPTERGEIREDITLFASIDGYNWKKIYRLQKGEVPGAYSNVATYGDVIAICYETCIEIKVQDISHLKKDILRILGIR